MGAEDWAGDGQKTQLQSEPNFDPEDLANRSHAEFDASESTAHPTRFVVVTSPATVTCNIDDCIPRLPVGEGVGMTCLPALMDRF